MTIKPPKSVTDALDTPRILHLAARPKRATAVLWTGDITPIINLLQEIEGCRPEISVLTASRQPVLVVHRAPDHDREHDLHLQPGEMLILHADGSLASCLEERLHLYWDSISDQSEA